MSIAAVQPGRLSPAKGVDGLRSSNTVGAVPAIPVRGASAREIGNETCSARPPLPPRRYYTGRDTLQDTGQVFPFNPDCPYVLQTLEERLSKRDPSLPGNFLHVTDLNTGGRMGNRFNIVSNNLKLGYCCQSKMVSILALYWDIPTS